jgi:TRAP-type C4-dicarboxylate transport system permease small subunit
MSQTGDPARPQLAARPPFIERLAGAIAVLGGLLLLAMAGLVVVSVVGRRFFNSPVNGDFELVSMGAAIAVFTFLPYTQARRGNILVDTFTNRLPARTNQLIDAFWDLVYAATMGFLAVCLIDGAFEHYRTGQTTMLLQIAIWPAIAISAALMVLLTAVALTTAVKLVRGQP